MVSSGLGYHMIKTPDSQWNLLGGMSYRSDKYSGPGVLINNQTRVGFDTAELLLSEDSANKLSGSANFNQRLSIRPNISGESGFLVTFDSTLMVMINKTLSLRVSFQDNFNSLSQAPIQKNDTLFFTGINVKFGE
jgi:putative salt-induced outer membrane protein